MQVVSEYKKVAPFGKGIEKEAFSKDLSKILSNILFLLSVEEIEVKGVISADFTVSLKEAELGTDFWIDVALGKYS